MRRQILFQPLFLRRSRSASAHRRGIAIRIQSDDVPIPQIKAVIATFAAFRRARPNMRNKESHPGTRTHGFPEPGASDS